MNRENIPSFDGKYISVAISECKNNPKGIVQISHGLAEHIDRYEDFFAYLNQNGYIVAGDDHRAHGLTDTDSLGLADDSDIFEDTVSDALMLTDVLIKRYNLPVVVIGHSYGSFLVRSYMTKQKNKMVKGYILSGTAHIAGLQLAFARLIARIKGKKQANKPAKIIINQTFKKYDKKTKEGKNDWLSRDAAIVGKYNLDPYCGFFVSYGFYRHFFNGIKKINKTASGLDSTTKIMIASGASDLFGGKGRLTQKVYKGYCKNGLTPSIRLYEKARHEILNETNKQEVYGDFLAFIDSCII